MRERAHEWATGAEGEADSSMSREPDLALDPRTLRSGPEPEASTLPTEPPPVLHICFFNINYMTYMFYIIYMLNT